MRNIKNSFTSKTLIYDILSMYVAMYEIILMYSCIILTYSNKCIAWYLAQDLVEHHQSKEK